MIYLNQFIRKLQDEKIVTLSWLKGFGIKKNHLRHYEKSGWVKSLGKGAFAREGVKISWEDGLHTLQFQLGRKVHLGAKSALIYRGLGHYVEKGESRLCLLGPSRVILDKWFASQDWGRAIQFSHFSAIPAEIGIEETMGPEPRLLVSSAERAILEMLCLTPNLYSFEESFHVMEGLNWLRPDLVQDILEKCTSVKGKRLFLFLGRYFHHPWMERIDLNKINLGSGKRVIVTGGAYDKAYQITVPHTLKDRHDEKPLF